jgi:menaquinone-dependent protoporphyrinogen oxidase
LTQLQSPLAFLRYIISAKQRVKSFKFIVRRGLFVKYLLVYCSSHGTTEKAATILANHLKGEVVQLNLNKKLESQYQVDLFDSIIIGGSIHAGMIQRKVKRFIENNHESLLRKQIGFFLCCMYEGDVAREQFDNAFPIDLRVRAVAKGLFGGEYLFIKMNFIEKMIVRKVSGVATETSNLDTSAILQFAQTFNEKLENAY